MDKKKDCSSVFTKDTPRFTGNKSGALISDLVHVFWKLLNN